ncbi:hypothetical protein CCMA1212_002622 [Trichoderma ghanense]|uniref:Uncharacterized protein n=1 Tax=Trichoderma ghanense TaxID=65468 RepID=A0ABY2HFA5_9HYPO
MGSVAGAEREKKLAPRWKNPGGRPRENPILEALDGQGSHWLAAESNSLTTESLEAPSARRGATAVRGARREELRATFDFRNGSEVSAKIHQGSAWWIMGGMSARQRLENCTCRFSPVFSFERLFFFWSSISLLLAKCALAIISAVAASYMSFGASLFICVFLFASHLICPRLLCCRHHGRFAFAPGAAHRPLRAVPSPMPTAYHTLPAAFGTVCGEPSTTGSNRVGDSKLLLFTARARMIAFLPSSSASAAYTCMYQHHQLPGRGPDAADGSPCLRLWSSPSLAWLASTLPIQTRLMVWPNRDHQTQVSSRLLAISRPSSLPLAHQPATHRGAIVTCEARFVHSSLYCEPPLSPSRAPLFRPFEPAVLVANIGPTAGKANRGDSARFLLVRPGSVDSGGEGRRIPPAAAAAASKQKQSNGEPAGPWQ